MEIVNVAHVEDALYQIDRNVNQADWEKYRPHEAAEMVTEWVADAVSKVASEEGAYIG